jgi:Fringe-like
MRICYVVLTCKKYLDTRVKWQKETVFKNIDPRDIIYLGHHMDLFNQIYSWGANDDYNSLPYKFYDFFRNIQFDYDWYVLIDDDTYVFHDRLVKYLSTCDTNELFAEGRILTHLADTEWGLYHSGGAGTVLSKKAYEWLCDFLRHSDKSRVPHYCADISLGYWLKQNPDMKMKDNELFHTDMYSRYNDNNFKKALTYHHLTNESNFLFYDNSSL